MYHRAIGRIDKLVIDFSECYYIDAEGLRWLSAAKAAAKATFIDRRSGDDRREIERAANPEARKEDPPHRRRKSDRRQRPQF